MEQRGPLGPPAQRREHEGMPSLGLVAPTASGREAENSYPKTDHWPLDKRQVHLLSYFLRVTNGLTEFIIGLERDYPPTVSTIAKTAGKLAPKGESGERCILCELWVGLYGSHRRLFTEHFRPTQRSVRGWKARTSIRSFTDEAPPVDDASSSLSLLSHMCYSCHTTLTSKSSRSAATPSWNPADSTLSDVHLPMWAVVQSASGRSDERDTSSPYSEEVWESKKLNADGMKSVIGGFLLE